jgi:hypothetical protein
VVSASATTLLSHSAHDDLTRQSLLRWQASIIHFF